MHILRPKTGGTHYYSIALFYSQCGQLSPTNKLFMCQITFSMWSGIEEMESVP